MNGNQRATTPANALPGLPGLPGFPGIAARAAETDQAARLLPQNWQDITDSGYLRLFHPTEHGGTGADSTAQFEAMLALARACPGTYWAATVSSLLCGNIVSRYSPTGEHARLLEPLLSGEKLACFAIVERTAGSDASTLQTTARPAGPAGSGYLISGEKSRITNAPVADLAVTLTRLDKPSDDGHQWALAFVDLHQPAVRRYDIPHMGLRGMPWGGITFTDAHVPDTDLVPVPFGEFGGELSESMAWGWLLISIAALGIAETALASSLHHAHERISSGRPLAHMEGVQAQLAHSRAQIDAAQLLARRALNQRTAGRPARDLIAMLKIYATETAADITARAIQIHGAAGLTQGHPVERLHRDAHMNIIGGFTSNRLREVVAEGLGLSSTHHPFTWLTPTGLNTNPPTLDGHPHPTAGATGAAA